MELIIIMFSGYFYFILITVFLNAMAQLLIKRGMIYNEFVFSFSNIFQNIEKIIFNPFIILGLICMVLSMITHIISLSKFDVSYAFPFISISYVIVFLGGYLLFKEDLNFLRLTGLLVIILGTILIAKS